MKDGKWMRKVVKRVKLRGYNGRELGRDRVVIQQGRMMERTVGQRTVTERSKGSYVKGQTALGGGSLCKQCLFFPAV